MHMSGQTVACGERSGNSGLSFVPSPAGKMMAYLMHELIVLQERVRDWQTRFGRIPLECRELTGDSSIADAQKIDDADIICTTPEKFGEYRAKQQR